MARLDRKARIEQDLAEVTAEVAKAQSAADEANFHLARLQKEQRGLQAALDIMIGAAPPPTAEPVLDRQAILQALASLAPAAASAHALSAEPSEQGGAGPLGLKPKSEIKFDLPEGWTKGVLNGEEILLEPGMEVTKNSFGEEVIAKKGTKFTAMAEPLAPEKHAELLPPIAAHDGFDSPEEMLDG